MTAPLAADVRGTAPGLFSALHLHLAAARWTCLLGPSGVGKSTILRLLAGLEVHADFDGSVNAEDAHPVPSRAAYMAQTPLLLPWASAVDNVVLGARLRAQRPDRARARALLDSVGLAGMADRKPNSLSGGQQQRVALARTLMEDQPFILLDEPFSALDARTRADMQELTHRLLRGKTVLLVTHDPSEAARMANRVFLMDSGGIETILPPSSPAPRAYDSPETLAFQARLLHKLRGAT